MKNVIPFRGDEVLKYAIYRDGRDSIVESETLVEGTNELSDILTEAHYSYGIYKPSSNGYWISNNTQDGTFKSVVIKKGDGNSLNQEENDFITALLNKGVYSENEDDGYSWSGKQNFGVGGWIFGGFIGAFLGYQLGKAVGYGRAHQGYALGGSVEDTEKIQQLVKKWVYFTFNYPNDFISDIWGNSFLDSHFKGKFAGFYSTYGTDGVMPNFYNALDGSNRIHLAKYILENYKDYPVEGVSPEDFADVITHWNSFCFNFPYGWVQKTFNRDTNHFLAKWNKAYSDSNPSGAVNVFFTRLSGDNQDLLIDWAIKNHNKGMGKFIHGGKAQGYNDKLDESLGNTTGRKSSMEQNYKDRRDEAKGMNKGMGHRAYQSVGTMDKMNNGGNVYANTGEVVVQETRKRKGSDLKPTTTLYSFSSAQDLIEKYKNHSKFEVIGDLNKTRMVLVEHKDGHKIVFRKRELFENGGKMADGGEITKQLEELENTHEKIRRILMDSGAVEYGDFIIDDISEAVGMSNTNAYYTEDEYYEVPKKVVLKGFASEKNIQELENTHEKIRRILMDSGAVEYGDFIIDDISEVVGIPTTNVYYEEGMSKGGSTYEGGGYVVQVFEGKDAKDYWKGNDEYESYDQFEIAKEENRHKNDVVLYLGEKEIEYYDAMDDLEGFEYREKWTEDYEGGGRISDLKKDLNEHKDVNVIFKLIPNDGSEEDGDKYDLDINYVGETYTGGLDSDEPFVELGFQVSKANAGGGDISDLEKDLKEYKDVNVIFKLIPNDGSEEDGDKYDLDINYVGETYTGGLDSDEPFVELGFQEPKSYEDGGMIETPYGEIPEYRLRQISVSIGNDEEDEIYEIDFEDIQSGFPSDIKKYINDFILYSVWDNYPEDYEVKLYEVVLDDGSFFDLDDLGYYGASDDYEGGGGVDDKNYEQYVVIYEYYSGKIEEEYFDNYSDAIKFYDESVDNEKDGGSSVIILEGYAGEDDGYVPMRYFDPREVEDEEEYEGGGEIQATSEYTFNELYEMPYSKLEKYFMQFYGYDGREEFDEMYENQFEGKSEKQKKEILIDNFKDYNYSGKFAKGGSTYQGGGGLGEIYSIGDASNKKRLADIPEKDYIKLLDEGKIVNINDLNDGYSYYHATDKEFEEEIKSKGSTYEGGGALDNSDYNEVIISLLNETGEEFDEIDDNTSGNILDITMESGAEYRVYLNEDDAYDDAVERVTQDAEENLEYFNKDFVMQHLDEDINKFFREVYDEMNVSYANDIKLEGDDKYDNRLIEEMVMYGLMSKSDAESGEASEIAEDRIDDFVETLTSDQMTGGDGIDYYRDAFGEDELYKLLQNNNLIDIDSLSQDAVDTDGIGHFISSYDGNMIYLDNGEVAFRTN